MKPDDLLNESKATKDKAVVGAKWPMRTKLVVIAVSFCIIIGIAFGLNQLLASSSMAVESKEDNPIVEVHLSEGIEFPWNYGWSTGINVVFGLPIQFTYENEEISFIITADGAELVKYEHGSVPATVVQQPVLMKSQNTIYWNMQDTDVWAQKDDMHYVHIIIKEQDQNAGYAVIKIFSSISELGGKVYFASVLAHVSFPKVDGQYQRISTEYVQEKIQEIEEKDRLDKQAG